LSVDEAAAKFEKDYGVKPEIEGKKIKVNATKFWAQKKSLKVALDHLGTGKVTTLVRARVLGKFGLVSWHPMTKLDKFAYKTTAAWTKAIKDKWKSKVTKWTATATGRLRHPKSKQPPAKRPATRRQVRNYSAT
jgi:hypothetical protein